MSKRGWRNHYREGMPFTERVIKDLRSALNDLKSRAIHKGRLPVILTYPDYPSKRTTIAAIAKRLNFRLTNKPFRADVVLFFDDQTFKSVLPKEISRCSEVILNEHCLDISKRMVDAIHLEVFGYNTFIDPLTFEGLAVEKSDTNAMHDGRYIQCPIDTVNKGSIYQRVIDNQCDEHRVMDYRVPIIGDEIPLVYRKFKSIQLRFTNDVLRSECSTPGDVFSELELSNIRAFARKMKADFCELDILRDKGDGKIYIIDLNTTPYGPPAKLGAKDRIAAIDQLSESFRKIALTRQISK